jgi:hypothetical protein
MDGNCPVWKVLMFLTTAKEAEEFFRRCIEQKAETEEARMKIIAEMVKERRMFPQTKEQVLKRMTGKRVLHVRQRRKS